MSSKTINSKKTSTKLYDVNIAGMPLKLKTSNDEAFVADLVEFVDKKIEMALGASKTKSFQSAALVSALNIAEEFLFLKKQVNERLTRMESKAESLVTDLESNQFSQIELDH